MSRKRKLSAKHLAALQRGRKRYQASKRKPKIPRRRYAPKGKHFERKTTIRGKTAYITSRLKRNPRPRFVIRGNRGVSSRDFWYYNGEGKFIKNRRAAKSYPSSIAAIGVARSIQNRLPFSIYSIEVVQVGKK